MEARALGHAFDYAVPAPLIGQVDVGALVACPLGRQTVLGVVIGSDAPTWAGTLVPLRALVQGAPPIPRVLVDLAGWIARYYVAPLASCLRLMLPPGAEGTLRRDGQGGWSLAPIPQGRRQLVASQPTSGGSPRQREVVAALLQAGGRLAASELCRTAGTTLATLRNMASAGLLVLRDEVVGDPRTVTPAPDVPPDLTAAQMSAVTRLTGMADAGGAALLHGVTGSGKTEVYLRLIEHARTRGKTSLVLVPEIALTPQIAGRLRARLGPRVAVWHSGLTPAERAREDRRIRRGDADVVLGARSAVFAPLVDIGVIVVDEEHDGSYKQDASPRYDARQVAFRRGQAEGALVVYGSATPRPETWAALPHVGLPERADGAALPRVEIVDMRTQAPGPVSRPLARAIQDAAGRGEKAILLLNRRGLARQILCRACGWIGRCPHCDVPLVVHDRPAHLVCHHCGHGTPVPPLCPSCGAADLSRQGSGTQGLEEALARIVPDVPLIRLDTDAVAGRGELERRLDRFARSGAAILFGTQMVAKGHDLPDVTVAGVLDADGPLQQPDFRAEERAFSLIVQLAGRAGRRGEPATVYVQAWEPGGRAVRLGAAHAVTEFLTGELARRQEHGFPPFGHLVRVVVDGDSPAAVHDEARILRELIAAALPEATVSGPATLHRLRGRARRALLVRGERATQMGGPIGQIVDDRAAARRTTRLRTIVDVDPQDT